MSKVEGLGNIWAEVVCDSISPWGDRVTTFRLHYHRFIHSEFMTHKMISKNASSSRAIPVHKQLAQVQANPATPIHWGLNEPGMQASAEGSIVLPHVGIDGYMNEGEDKQYVNGEHAWLAAANSASDYASTLWKGGKGYHKQIANRIAEPFTFMNVVATATDWENFFWLRFHADAQPEIAELARVMWEAREASTPFELRHGEWHLPYVTTFRDNTGMVQYCDDDGTEIYTLEEAIKISSSCCAQASYRSLDQSIEKAVGLFDRLVGGEPLHASPFEHPCTPFSEGDHMARNEAQKVMYAAFLLLPEYTNEMAQRASEIAQYSANFRGFTQYRKTMPNENITKTFEKS